mgnify:CR=1 FL=1
MLLVAHRRAVDVCCMPLSVGGGIRQVEDARRLLLAGADKISVNTAAVERRELVSDCADAFGSQAVVVAIDAKRTGDRWHVFTYGGRTDTGLDVVDYAADVVRRGAGEILLTSMDRDGTKSGFDNELTRLVADAVSVPVVASGGVGTLDHMVDGIVEGHADAVLAASIFHFGEYSIAEAKTAMRAAGLPVRLEQ